MVLMISNLRKGIVNMRKKISFLLCVILLLTSGCSRYNKNVRFGAADIGGMYYTFANTFTQIASDNISDYTFEVKATAGSSANLRLLSENYIGLGIAQADLIKDAYNKNDNIRAIAALYTEACQLVVRADSDITSLNDLQGRTISIGSSESGTELNATKILEFSGLPSAIINTENMDYTEAADSLESGQIDAFFCTAGIKTTVIDELAKKCDIRLVSIDESCINKMLQYSDAYTKYTIPADTYPGQTENVETIGVKSVLLASDSMSDDLVEKLTGLLFSESNKLQYSASMDLEIGDTFSTEGVLIPFHDGALKYYEKHNIKTDNN